MSSILLEFTIVDERNQRLWVRNAMDFNAARALTALEVLQARFPAARLFLQAIATDALGRAPRRLMLRCPNLKTASLQAEAVHGAEPERDETGMEAAREEAQGGDPASSDFANHGSLIEVEVWHRRRLIRHLNYPGLSFATEAPEQLPRADFERVADFLAPALQPLNAVFRMSQNTGHSWLPGEDRRSTSIGDVLVVKGARNGADSSWMVMAMGFDRVASFN